MTLCVPAYATDTADAEDTVISFEEYLSAVKAEYARYHVKVECIDYNENFVFTKGMLEEKLNDIEAEMSNLVYDTSTNSFVGVITAEEDSSEDADISCAS